MFGRGSRNDQDKEHNFAESYSKLGSTPADAVQVLVSGSSQHDGPSSNVKIRSDVEPFAIEAEAQNFIDRNALRVFDDIR